MSQIFIKHNQILEFTDVVEVISKFMEPQIILWYIGSHGLKKSSVNFHRNIIAPLYNHNLRSQFYLYDLTAWAAIKNSNVNITKTSSHVTKINSIDANRIKCITSSTIFSKMQNISNIKLIEYFQTTLKKDFIWKNSLNRAPSGITLKHLFNNNCQLLNHYLNIDANLCYSMLQYLEGILIIDEILHKKLSSTLNNEIQIFFVLPNDEIKYYYDRSNSFEKDLTFFLKQKYKSNLDNVKITINFSPFKYGELSSQRPYHENSSLTKANELKKLHIFN